MSAKRSVGMKRRNLESDDAVSELVDFSIILSIILLATAIIVVAGYPLIQHLQENQHSENIVQSFQVLAPNINKVVKGSAPSQSIELKMYGGSLSVTSVSYMEINMKVWNAANGSYDTETFAKHIGTIENNYKDTYVCYENTGIWSKYQNGHSLMKLEPLFSFSDNVLLIPCSSLSGSSSLSGTGLVSVTANGGRRTIERHYNVSQVNISIKSDYFEAWEKYLNESMEMPVENVDWTNSTVSTSRDYPSNIDVFIVEAPMHITIN